MKGALQDEADLKRKKKRLTIDWFFRPKDDQILDLFNNKHFRLQHD